MVVVPVLVVVVEVRPLVDTGTPVPVLALPPVESVEPLPPLMADKSIASSLKLLNFFSVDMITYVLRLLL